MIGGREGIGGLEVQLELAGRSLGVPRLPGDVQGVETGAHLGHDRVEPMDVLGQVDEVTPDAIGGEMLPAARTKLGGGRIEELALELEGEPTRVPALGQPRGHALQKGAATQRDRIAVRVGGVGQADGHSRGRRVHVQRRQVGEQSDIADRIGSPGRREPNRRFAGAVGAERVVRDPDPTTLDSTQEAAG